MVVELVLVACAAALAPLALIACHRAWLLARFRPREQADFRTRRALPPLTVQLPLFNERAVAARAIAALAALDYPRDRFSVQVLDDSTDATREIVDVEVERWRASGVNISIVRREERAGFKAGALANGLRSVTTPLVAVFDADFVPAPGFLRELVGAFEDERVGMVQARWEHLDRDASLLVRAQAALLDGHFVITHKVRRDEGRYTHFNGTAGIWRRAAIDAAGGWQSDTLTEDLDLSYRAQLRGWRFEYAVQVVAPAELPATLDAFQAQQRRWARGTVQSARKLLPALWHANLPWATRIESSVHLLTHFAHPAVLALAVLAPFAVRVAGPSFERLVLATVPFGVGALWLFYERAQAAIGRSFAQRALDSTAALLLGIGMSLSLSRAALRGLFGDVGEFERTPKSGRDGRASYAVRAPRLRGMEWLLAVHAAWGAAMAAERGLLGSATLLVVFTLGFGWVGALSIAATVSSPRGADRKETWETSSNGRASSSSHSTATAP
jgi:hypothetical protein